MQFILGKIASLTAFVRNDAVLWMLSGCPADIGLNNYQHVDSLIITLNDCHCEEQSDVAVLLF